MVQVTSGVKDGMGIDGGVSESTCTSGALIVMSSLSSDEAGARDLMCASSASDVERTAQAACREVTFLTASPAVASYGPSPGFRRFQDDRGLS